MQGIVPPMLLQWGIVIFKDANPHLPPPLPVPVVVGHYIDRCIVVYKT